MVGIVCLAKICLADQIHTVLYSSGAMGLSNRVKSGYHRHGIIKQAAKLTEPGQAAGLVGSQQLHPAVSSLHPAANETPTLPCDIEPVNSYRYFTTTVLQR